MDNIVIVYTLYSDSAVFIYIVAHAYLYILYLWIVLCPYIVHLQTRTLQMWFYCIFSSKTRVYPRSKLRYTYLVLFWLQVLCPIMQVEVFPILTPILARLRANFELSGYNIECNVLSSKGGVLVYFF